MKAKLGFSTSLAVSLFLSVPLYAATFSGSHKDITDFANGSEVSTDGTLIDAVNLLNATANNVSVNTTINGVLFKGTWPGAYHEGAESFADASFVYNSGEGYADDNLWTSGGAYDTLADSQIFNVDYWWTNYGDGYGVINLQPGKLYELQIFMLDDRAGVDKTFPLQFEQVTFTGDINHFVSRDPAPPDLGYIDGITIGGAGVTQPNGEIATVRFSIDPEYNGIFVNTWNSGAFNGMQLRLLGLVGDYDGNGSVGPEDYILWKNTFGSTSNLAADGNGDGVVDAADYTIWRDYATISGGGARGSSAVPEPSSMVILLSAVFVIAGAKARRRNRGC